MSSITDDFVIELKAMFKKDEIRHKSMLNRFSRAFYEMDIDSWNAGFLSGMREAFRVSNGDVTGLLKTYGKYRDGIGSPLAENTSEVGE